MPVASFSLKLYQLLECVEPKAPGQAAGAGFTVLPEDAPPLLGCAQQTNMGSLPSQGGTPEEVKREPCPEACSGASLAPLPTGRVSRDTLTPRAALARKEGG